MSQILLSSARLPHLALATKQHIAFTEGGKIRIKDPILAVYGPQFMKSQETLRGFQRRSSVACSMFLSKDIHH